MNNMSSKTELQASDRTVSADVMIKRVLRVARILAAVQYPCDSEEEITEIRAENPLRGKLQYREEQSTSHSV
ncbi:MAG: hypothetical protein AELANPGJ_03666 [Anaerolineae bacterium]|nr:hypothetical protein [Anaerolineae bacterium]